ncbi:MAG: hypothetical protein ACKVS6_07945 [Planctomycetota bacterium]
MAQDDCSFAPSRLLVFSRGIKLFHLTVYGIAIRMLPILLITLSSIWIHSFDSILALQLAILGLSTSIIGAYFQTVSNGATYLSLALTILTLCITNTLPLNPLDKLNSGLFVEFLVFETLLCFGFGAAYSFSLRRR